MSTNITLRLQKGAALTYAEMDDNFKEIQALARGSEDSPVAGGTADALTVTSSQLAVTTLEAGMAFGFYAASNNTGAATLDVDGTGAKAIVRPDGSALRADDIDAGVFYQVVYNAGINSYQIMSGVSKEFIDTVGGQTVDGDFTATGTITSSGLEVDSGTVDEAAITLSNTEGSIKVIADNNNYVVQDVGSGFNYFAGVNGGVESRMYGSGIVRIATDADGINVTGQVDATSSASSQFNGVSSGTLTGIVCRTGTAGFRLEEFATNNQIRLWHTDSAGTNTDACFVATKGGYTDIRYAGAAKLTTTSGGVAVTGVLTATGDVTGNTSDIRTKIITGEPTGAECLNAVRSWSVIRHKNNDINPDADTENEHIGLIAQQVQVNFPELTPLAPFDRDEDGNSKSGEDYLTIKYDRTVAVLVGAIKEQQRIIEEMKNDITSLRANQPQ